MAEYWKAVWAFWKTMAFILVIFGGLAAYNELKTGKVNLGKPWQGFLGRWYSEHGVKNGYIPPNTPEGPGPSPLARPAREFTADPSDPFDDLPLTDPRGAAYPSNN